MNWRVKRALRHAVLCLPRGAELYRWLAREVAGTNARMPYKWFRVLPARVELLQARFGPQARAQRMWCYDCGATMAAGLAMAVASDAPGLLTSRRAELSDRYCEVSRRVLAEKGPPLAEMSRAPEGRVARLLAASEGRDAVAALRAVGMTYAPSHAAAQEPEWKGRIGCIFSGGTLEHYTPEELESEVAAMAQALQPGGVMSHVVDHRDHRWHADKGLSPLAHLTLSEEDFGRAFGNRLEYHNRWLRSDYAALFTRHGFHVEGLEVIAYGPELPPLPEARLADPFRGRPESDYRCLVTRFVATRP